MRVLATNCLVFAACLAPWVVQAVLLRPSAAADVQQWLDEDALTQQLHQPITVSWSKSPFRDSLQRFGRSHA